MKSLPLIIFLSLIWLKTASAQAFDSVIMGTIQNPITVPSGKILVFCDLGIHGTNPVVRAASGYKLMPSNVLPITATSITSQANAYCLANKNDANLVAAAKQGYLNWQKSNPTKPKCGQLTFFIIVGFRAGPFNYRDHGVLDKTTIDFGSCVANPTLSCADPNHSPAFNVGTTSSNNVPVSMCYINTAGACVYNTANPATATGAWNAACPSRVASTDCCRWKKQSPTGCVDTRTGNIQITSTSVTNYPGLTATSSYYGKVTVNYKNIGGTFCKAPQFSFYYKAIFTNAIANGGPASTSTTTLANQTGTTTWQFGREQTGVDCKTTKGPKNAQIEIGMTPTTSSHLTLPVTVNCP